MDEEINRKLNLILSYFQDEPITPGIFSRIRKNEEFRKLGSKVNWLLVVCMIGIIIKTFS
jgi:hypothetical protein